MGARSLNLRPIYDDADYQAYGAPARGIAAAIDLYAQNADANRQERNQIAAQGGTQTAPPPSVLDRARGVGRKVKGIADALRSALPGSSNSRDGVAPVLAQRVDGVDTRPAVVPQQLPVPMPGGGAITPPPLRAPRRAGTEPDADQYGGAADADADDRSRRPSIANALASYTYEGRNGAKYSVDPTIPVQRELYAKDVVKQRDDAEKIDALVAAGMDPKEARARVLNNVVRYDETFGQQRTGGRGGSTLTFAERERLQAQNNAVRLQIARLSAAGRQNSEEFRQLTLELRRQEALLHSYENEASAAERGIPEPGTPTLVAEATPQGKAAVADARRRAAEARRKVEGQRGRVAGVGKTYSTDPDIAAAQRMWDASPRLQQARPRPQ